MYNLSSGQEVQITTAQEDDEYPIIKNNILVWYSEGRISSYNLDTHEVKVLIRYGATPYFSFDGNNLIFSWQGTEKRDLMLLNIDKYSAKTQNKQ